MKLLRTRKKQTSWGLFLICYLFVWLGFCVLVVVRVCCVCMMCVCCVSICVGHVTVQKRDASPDEKYAKTHKRADSRVRAAAKRAPEGESRDPESGAPPTTRDVARKGLSLLPSTPLPPFRHHHTGAWSDPTNEQHDTLAWVAGKNQPSCVARMDVKKRYVGVTGLCAGERGGVWSWTWVSHNLPTHTHQKGTSSHVSQECQISYTAPS